MIGGRVGGVPASRRPQHTRPGGQCQAHERGSASILVALWAVVLTMLAAAGIVLTSVLASRESVAAGADLAALAGASATWGGTVPACDRARRAGQRNGVVIHECRVAGTDIWVSASMAAPPAVLWLVPGWNGVLRGRAHAALQPGTLPPHDP